MESLKSKLTIEFEPQLERCLRQIQCHSKVTLFGAGTSGMRISQWLISNGIIPLGFVDSNCTKWGKTLNGICVYSQSALEEVLKDSLIIVSCGDYIEIVSEIRKFNVSDNKILYIDPKWIMEPQGLKEFIECNLAKLQNAYELLADEKSRNVFVNMLRYKISYNIEWIADICEVGGIRYFDKELIDMKCVKNYVDAGGYIGDTVDAFVRVVEDGNYENIYVFEPNEINMIELKKLIKEKNYHDVFLYQMGLSNKSEYLYFDTSSEISTKINKDGQDKIFCNRLDEILKNKKVDLIKMDIEGAEMRALEGAENIIKNLHPILSICVYHKPEDYYEIPLKIKEMYPGYKIYFRQYELSDTETVCYAVGE